MKLKTMLKTAVLAGTLLAFNGQYNSDVLAQNSITSIQQKKYGPKIADGVFIEFHMQDDGRKELVDKYNLHYNALSVINRFVDEDKRSELIDIVENFNLLWDKQEHSRESTDFKLIESKISEIFQGLIPEVYTAVKNTVDTRIEDYASLTKDNADQYTSWTTDEASKYSTWSKDEASKYSAWTIDEASKYSSWTTDEASKYSAWTKDEISKYGSWTKQGTDLSDLLKNEKNSLKDISDDKNTTLDAIRIGSEFVTDRIKDNLNAILKLIDTKSTKVNKNIKDSYDNHVKLGNSLNPHYKSEIEKVSNRIVTGEPIAIIEGNLEKYDEYIKLLGELRVQLSNDQSTRKGKMSAEYNQFKSMASRKYNEFKSDSSAGYRTAKSNFSNLHRDSKNFYSQRYREVKSDAREFYLKHKN